MQIKAKKPQMDVNVESYFDNKINKPIKNVHSFMHIRHKVLTKEDAEKSNAEANHSGVYRIYQWNEDINKQRYDRVPVTGKIGYS